MSAGSFTISLRPEHATVNYDFRFPTTAGSAGQVLTSQGGAVAMTWTTPTTGTVTSVAMTVPSILSVTGSPITSSGTFAITTTNTPTGTGSIVLAASPTLTGTTTFDKFSTSGQTGDIITVAGVQPAIFVNSTANGGKGVKVAVNEIGSTYIPFTNSGDTCIFNVGGGGMFLSATNPASLGVGINGTTNNFTVYKNLVLAGSPGSNVTTFINNATSAWNFQLPTSAGSSGQVLTSQGGATAMTWTTPTTGTVTSVAMTVPSILTVTGSPITSSGTFAITTTNTPTGTGSIVLATSPTLVTPTLGVATGTSLGLSGGLSMADSRVFLRSLGDNNHSLYWLTGLDGLVLTGLGGGRLASGTAAATTSLSWNTSGVSIPGTIVLGTTNTTTIINAASSSYSFRLPTTAGSAGQVLTSQGGASAMTWTTPTTGTVTSVAITVPSILSVSGSPITSSGIF